MIIGFCGRARHGKDWTARHAQTLLRERAVTRGFAQELKQRVHQALRGMPDVEIAIAEKPPWMRGILQAFGNGVREADAEFWVRTLFEWYEKEPMRFNTYTPWHRILLIPDVRYPNEVAAIKARGGKVVKVVRTQMVSWNEYPDMEDTNDPREIQYRDPNTDPGHPSEYLLDTIPDSEFDAIFYARSGETKWLEQCIEERLVAWGLLARNDGGMGDDL